MEGDTKNMLELALTGSFRLTTGMCRVLVKSATKDYISINDGNFLSK